MENDLVVLLDDDGYWEATVEENYYSDDTPFGVAIPGAVRDSELVVLVQRYVAGETGDLLKGGK